MDIRTGKRYETREEAKADGVPDSDIAEVDERPMRRGKPPKVSFARRTFGSFKNVKGARGPKRLS